MDRLTLLTFLILLTSLRSINGATKKTPILKCCNDGESLIMNGELGCEPKSVDFDNWMPKIYSLRKKVFLGSPPSNWIFLEANRPNCSHDRMTILRVHDAVLLESGSLFYGESKITPDRFCIDSQATLTCSELAEKLINPKQIVSVRKCCGKGGIYSETNSSCVISSAISDFVLPSGTENFNSNYTVSFSAGFPNCHNTTGFVVAGSINNFKLNNDGSLSSKSNDNNILSGSFCIEHLKENLSSPQHVFVCPDTVIITQKEPETDWKLTLYAIGLIISAMFLAATLATGFLLPSSHHMLHWRCQRNYVGCLLIGDILLAITQIAGHQITGATCSVIAISMHFCFLAAFFWLNTMCFNIWWTFRDLRPASLERAQEACRLRLYEAYAWGGPLFIAGTAAVLDNMPMAGEFLRPRFGHRMCWFYGDMEILTYFYGPIGVLLTVNLILFLLTARELTCGLWKREVVKSTTERAALGRVCLKLVVVMGVSWVADVISWVIGGPEQMWYITDILNTLQGVFIFIVIGCQPQVWAAVKRMWCVHQGTTSGVTNHGNHHSSSSHGLPSLGDSVTNNTFSNATNMTTISIKLPPETSC